MVAKVEEEFDDVVGEDADDEGEDDDQGHLQSLHLRRNQGEDI